MYMDQKSLDTVRYIRLAANRYDGDLTAAGFNDHAGPTRQTACRRLDCGWNDAKALAGLGATRVIGASAEELRADVERVGDELGKKPSYAEYNEHGRFSSGPIRRRLGDGSWNDGLEAIGVVPQWEQGVPEERLECDLRGLGIALGRAPSITEHTKMGRYSTNRVMNSVGDGKWSTACSRAGFDPNVATDEHVEDGLADVEEVARLYEDGWTTPELAEKYNCNPNSVSWRLKEHGVDMRGPGYRSVHCDLLNTWVDSKTERDFARGLDDAGLLEGAEYHPDAIENASGRWEPDFEVNGWLVECKQGTWGGVYAQRDVMAECESPILVYGLDRDVAALPHDRAIRRVPGSVPDLVRVLE